MYLQLQDLQQHYWRTNNCRYSHLCNILLKVSISLIQKSAKSDHEIVKLYIFSYYIPLLFKPSSTEDSKYLNLSVLKVLTKHLTMQTYGEVEVKLHTFIILALARGDWFQLLCRHTNYYFRVEIS
jgi:hypothetical protein